MHRSHPICPPLPGKRLRCGARSYRDNARGTWMRHCGRRCSPAWSPRRSPRRRVCPSAELVPHTHASHDRGQKGLLARSPSRHHPPVTGGKKATSSPLRNAREASVYSMFTAIRMLPGIGSGDTRLHNSSTVIASASTDTDSSARPIRSRILAKYLTVTFIVMPQSRLRRFCATCPTCRQTLTINRYPASPCRDPPPCTCHIWLIRRFVPRSRPPSPRRFGQRSVRPLCFFLCFVLSRFCVCVSLRCCC